MVYRRQSSLSTTRARADSQSNEELIGMIIELVSNAKKGYVINHALDECVEDEGSRERKAKCVALPDLQSSTTNCLSIFVWE